MRLDTNSWNGPVSMLTSERRCACWVLSGSWTPLALNPDSRDKVYCISALSSSSTRNSSNSTQRARLTPPICTRRSPARIRRSSPMSLALASVQIDVVPATLKRLTLRVAPLTEPLVDVTLGPAVAQRARIDLQHDNR